MAMRGNPWSAERTERLCAMLVDGKSHLEIANAMGVGKKAISSRVHRMREIGDSRLPSDVGAYVSPYRRAVPPDFADNAALLTDDLIERYGAGRATISRWRKEIGQPGRSQFRAKALPENFAIVAPTLTLKEACARFDVSSELLRRWEERAGVKLRRVRVQSAGSGRLKMDRDNTRNMSSAGMAADHLRRLGPVFRCDDQGRPKETGKLWRRGRYVLTDAEIIERAERNGWKPDAWRTVVPTSPINHGASA